MGLVVVMLIPTVMVMYPVTLPPPVSLIVPTALNVQRGVGMDSSIAVAKPVYQASATIKPKFTFFAHNFQNIYELS
jgi:hypothetical protein